MPLPESRDRVMAAVINSGFTFTFGRTTINLAPADVKKEGPSFDLPIAIGIVSASERMESDQLENFVMVGELALNGAVRSVKGVLPIALRAREEGRAGVLVPPENAAEAAVVAGLQVIPVQNLREAAGFLEGEVKISPTKVDTATIFDQDHEAEVDFAEVKGQSWPNQKWAPVFHGKMRFHLNSGRTSAVNTWLGLGGDAAGLPKSPRDYKGDPTDTLQIPSGYPPDTLRIPSGDIREIQGITSRAPRGKRRAGAERPEHFLRLRIPDEPTAIRHQSLATNRLAVP